jgi:hypothetical protein
MPRFLPDQSLSFVAEFVIDSARLKEIISTRYEEIVSTYKLSADEKIFNPWSIEVNVDGIFIKAIQSDELDDSWETEIIPSLLIYLKIFGEIGNIIPGECQLYYIQGGGDYNGILTVPIDYPLNIVLTNVTFSTGIQRIDFNIVDLDYRNFMINKEAFDLIKERTNYLPTVSGLLPTPHPPEISSPLDQIEAPPKIIELPGSFTL